MRVEPKPIENIVLKKIHYGKVRPATAKITSYDPRAPSDRSIIAEALNNLGERLSACLQSSSFFLFHNIQPKVFPNYAGLEESICETVPECAPAVSEECFEEKGTPFNDDYDISYPEFKEMVNLHLNA